MKLFKTSIVAAAAITAFNCSDDSTSGPSTGTSSVVASSSSVAGTSTPTGSTPAASSAVVASSTSTVKPVISATCTDASDVAAATITAPTLDLTKAEDNILMQYFSKGDLNATLASATGKGAGIKWAECWTKAGSLYANSPGYTPTTIAPSETLTGDITTDVTLDASKVYELKGYVVVKAGATLTIPAGTAFKSEGKSALIVVRGGKVMAEGTKTNPIVFTSKSATPKAGDWAGIVIFGKAPVAHVDGEIEFEGNETGVLEEKFGGQTANDNSGILKYVVIEYAGFVVGTDAELNGLTLGGVGSGTVIENVQSHAGLDDAIEWFGGTVNVKNLVASSQGDDGFDIDYGYTGSATNMLYVGGANSDKGIEAGSKGNGDHITAPIFKNITLSIHADAAKKTAIHLKKNVAGTYENLAVVGAYEKVISAEGANTLASIKSGKTTLNGATGAKDIIASQFEQK